MKYKTEQENFWAEDFGNEYIKRNSDKKIVAANIKLFSKIISKTTNINSIIEFGANVGNNLKAIQSLLPDCKLSAIEINNTACKELSKNNIDVYSQSILDFRPNQKWDMVFTKGVLIHINPEELENVYEKLYESSQKYILIAEYYNPNPIEVKYRGHSNKLFKRDFAGEILDKYKDLSLTDYGFTYHRDNNFPSDDITWFLMEKK